MKESNAHKPEVVVSMTSFPQAIPYAVKAIQSILNGTVLPDRLVLYLYFSQFGEAGIPDELVRLSKENSIFEIRNYDRDLRSYLKLIPALADFPEAVIVTVDDDIDYHPDMLRNNGVPEEMIAAATETMAQINAAWADLRRVRGI